jgi:hypothetical protein
VAKPGITLTGEWRKLRAILNPGKFRRRLETEVGKATTKNALLVRRAIREAIRSNIRPDKSPLSVALARGGTKTLIGRTSALWRSVTHLRVSWNRGFAGVLRRGKRKRGVDLFNLAVTLHEGASIKVTDRMRGLFAALFWARMKGDPSILKSKRARELWRAAPGFEWRRLSPSTRAIRIPGRPFVKKALRDRRLRQEVEKNWNDAVDRAFRTG